MRVPIPVSRAAKVGIALAITIGSTFTAGSSGAVSMSSTRAAASSAFPAVSIGGSVAALAPKASIAPAVLAGTANSVSPQQRFPAPDKASLRRSIAVSKSAPKKAAPKKTAPVRMPATPAGLPAGIEPLPSYVAQTACEPGFRPGTAALAQLLQSTYPGTHSGGVYACGTDGIISEHYDGRAIDWMDSVRQPTQAAQAQAVLHWLLDTDKAGNKFAIARRIGLMYVIWNNSIWSASDQRWDPYEDCAQTPSPSRDSFCHRNHIHLSLSWDGAFGRTSFFNKHVVTRFDVGPCRAKDMNWAGHYTGPNYQGCVVYPKLTPPATASPISKALIQWSGDQLTPGAVGPAVIAVQNALAVPATGTYDHPTLSAVLAFQRAHGLSMNPVIAEDTWRVLVAVSAQPAPAKPTPKKVTPKKVTPRRVTPRRVTPKVLPTKPAPTTPAPSTPAPSTPAPSPALTPSASATRPVLTKPAAAPGVGVKVAIPR